MGVDVVFRGNRRKVLIQRDPAAYRRDVHLPGPVRVDRCLRANLHLDSSDSEVFQGLSLNGKATQHVQCNVHRVRVQVRTSTVVSSPLRPHRTRRPSHLRHYIPRCRSLVVSGFFIMPDHTTEITFNRVTNLFVRGTWLHNLASATTHKIGIDSVPATA